MMNIKLLDKEFSPFISASDIENAVTGLANRINSDYDSREPVFLIVAKGALIFAVDLLKKINLTCVIELVSAKSYGAEMISSGKVETRLPDFDFSGKDVIIVEDIIDTGITLDSLKNELKRFRPASVEIVALISKPERREVEIEVKYVGIVIPDKFIVGYGLDYAERGRNLTDIYSYEG